MKPPLFDSVLRVFTEQRDERPICLVCRESIRPSDSRVRLRGGGAVHRVCATYRMRQRPERLGYRR